MIMKTYYLTAFLGYVAALKRVSIVALKISLMIQVVLKSLLYHQLKTFVSKLRKGKNTRIRKIALLSPRM